MADEGIGCVNSDLTDEEIIRSLFTTDANGNYALRVVDNDGCANDIPCDGAPNSFMGLLRYAIGMSSCGKLAIRLANASNPAEGYKVYTALLTQAGTAAPTKKILKNTIGDGTGVGAGDLVWTRVSAGVYKVRMVGAFTANKTWTIVSSTGNTMVSTDNVFGAPDEKYVYTTDPSTGTQSDGLLNDTSFEIRVYN